MTIRSNVIISIVPALCMFQAAVTLLGIYLLGKLTARCILFLMQNFPSLLPAAIPDAAGNSPLNSLSLQPLLFPVSAAVHAKQTRVKINLMLLAGPPSIKGPPDFITRDSPPEIPAFLRSFHSLFRMLICESLITTLDSFAFSMRKPAAVLQPAVVSLVEMEELVYFGHIKLSVA